jgi:hypothetical protein
MNICFFTVGFTEQYAHIANCLAYTFKKNTNYTLKVFTNYPDIVNFGDPIFIENLKHDNYMFKFNYFKKIKKLVEADFYIYVDADSYIVKPLLDIESLLTDSKMVVFLEQKLTGNSQIWHGKKLETLNILFNEVCNTQDQQYYNLNGGFFGFKNDVIDEAVNRSYEIYEKLKTKIKNFTEEFVLSCITPYYIDNIEKYLLTNNLKIIATDNGGVYNNKIPKRYETWKYIEWFTQKEYFVNPAIVHCPSNKQIFYKLSKDIFSIQKKENVINNKGQIIFNIIIAGSRPYNLPFVFKSIEKFITPDINYKIWLIFDVDPVDIDNKILNYCNNVPNLSIFFAKNNLNKKNIGGHASKNYALSLITDGWVYQLDDDNLIHPLFFKRIAEYINNYPDKELFLFSQKDRLFPENNEDVRAGIVDTAMYVIKRDLIGDHQIPLEYGGDGHFLQNLYENNIEKSLIIKEILCYYNQLNEL